MTNKHGHLSPQSKLALMMTSAGSQRRLAALMVVSHQKVGRWLREGESAVIDPYTGMTVHGAGAKHIPESAHDLIDTAFEHHKQACRLNAISDDVPYLENTPVFMFRKPLRNGEPGQRAFVMDTQYIRKEVRTQILASMQRTNRIYTASVRSTVDFIKYTGAIVDRERKAGLITGTRKQMIADSIQQFGHFNNIRMESINQPLFTKLANFQPGANVKHVVNDVESQLQQKHSKSATSFADEYIFHIIPQNYEPAPPKQYTKSKQRIKPTNKRGK